MNVTISLPDDVAKAARHLAVDKGVSLSKFVANLIEQEVSRDRAYWDAYERHRKIVEKGYDLGTYGKATWTRDELHER